MLSIAEAGKRQHVARWYLHSMAPRPDFDRWYGLPPMAVGTYEVRLLLAYEIIARAKVHVAEVGRALKKTYADTLLGYSTAGSSRPHKEPYGMLSGQVKVQAVNPAIVLGDPGPGPFSRRKNPNLQFLSLPKGSSVTVGFSEVVIVDGPGPDLIIRSVESSDSAGELAEVSVSTDLQSFHRIGRVYEAGAQLIDLDVVELNGPVLAVRITGLDLGGRIPGFDLISVEALNFQNPASFDGQNVRK